MKTLTVILAVAMISASTFAADGPIRHVVSFKFKKDASPEQIKKVEESFAALKTKVSQIQDLEWGTNSSPEKHSKGFTHVWFVTFKNAADRDAYLVHPEHSAFAGGLKDVIDDVFVVDYVPMK